MVFSWTFSRLNLFNIFQDILPTLGLPPLPLPFHPHHQRLLMRFQFTIKLSPSNHNYLVPVDFIGENHFLYQPQFTLAWPLSSGIPLGFDGWYELWRPWWSGQPDEGPRWPGGPHQDGGLWRLCGGAKHPGVRPPSTPLSHLSTAAVTLSPSPRFSLWAQVGLPRPLLLLLPHPDGLLSPWTFPASGLPAPSIILPLSAASRRRWAATGGQCGHQAGAVSQSRWIFL